MISREKDYIKAMRAMIARVGETESVQDIDTFQMSLEEAEILSDCINEGYLIGTATPDMRTLDGKMHSELINNVITPKGLAFLKPNKTERKSNVALITSIVAVSISFFAFLTTLIANIDKIVSNWELFWALFN